MYCDFLYGFGWIVNPKVNSIFSLLKESELREDSDDRVGTYDNSIHPCSFKTFQRFWLAHYHKLQMSVPTYDTCATCFKFSCNLYVIHQNAKEKNIYLRINILIF